MMRASLAILCFVFAASGRTDSAAEECFKKCAERFAAAKSFSVAEVDGTDPGGMDCTRTQRALRPGFWSSKGPEGEFYCDGKTRWYYQPSRNTFQKEPTYGQVWPFRLFPDKAPEHCMLKEPYRTQFDGRDCIAVECTDEMWTHEKSTYYFEPNTYLPVGIARAIDGSGIRSEQAFRDLKLDAELKPEEFRWKPPLDAKLTSQPKPDSPIAVGQTAPQFALKTPAGKQISLAKLLARSKAVIVSFWAYWPVLARVQWPELNAMYKELRPNGLEVVAVDTGDPQALLERFLEVNKVAFPIVIDVSNGARAETRYHIPGVPSTFLVGSDGKILLVQAGWDAKEMRQALAAVGIGGG